MVDTLEKHTTKLLKALQSSWSLRAIVALGILFRITEYLHNRSFNEAEAPLAMSIIHRSWASLLDVADYVQPGLTAAPGFAYIEKIVTQILGNTEPAFRIFPLIAGIVGLLLFVELARRYLDRAVLPVALFFFATNDYLIVFSSEAKQYSLDVSIAIALVLFALWIVHTEMKATHLLFFGLSGTIALWFSHPAVFVYAAGTTIVLYAIIRARKWHLALVMAISSSTVLVIFGLMYLLVLRNLSNLITGFRGSFVPLVPTSLADLQLLGYCLLRTIKNPMGSPTYELGLAAVSFVIGLVVIFRKRPYVGALITVTFFFTLIASSLKRYPFEGRLLLFTTPFLVLALAQGLCSIYRATKKGSWIIGIALVALLMMPSAYSATYHLFRPRTSEELRPVMLYFKERYQPGDIVYIYYAAVNAFQYYAERFGFEHLDSITGSAARNNPEIYYQELNELKGNHRVWIVFSHIFRRGIDEEILFVSYLKSIGVQCESLRVQGAALYLFDLADTE